MLNKCAAIYTIDADGRALRANVALIQAYEEMGAQEEANVRISLSRALAISQRHDEALFSAREARA